MSKYADFGPIQPAQKFGGERPLTLTDFLLARIAEDEREANDFWENDYPGQEPEPGSWWHWVLTECAVKRRLLVREDNPICTCWSPDPEDVPTDWRDRSRVLLHHDDCTCLAVGAVLALPYADHPDYREEWKP